MSVDILIGIARNLARIHPHLSGRSFCGSIGRAAWMKGYLTIKQEAALLREAERMLTLNELELIKKNPNVNLPRIPESILTQIQNPIKGESSLLIDEEVTNELWK